MAPAEAVGVTVAVHSLMAGADERRYVRKGGSGREDALADERIAFDELPLVGVEESEFFEDRVGDRCLADVVELGGQSDTRDPLGVPPEPVRSGGCELGDFAEVRAEVRVLFDQDLNQGVACLDARGGAKGPLLRLQALIGEMQRLFDVVAAAETSAKTSRRGDRERLSRLLQRFDRRCDDFQWLVGEGENAELVAAHAIGGDRPESVSPRRRLSRARSASPAG